MRMCVYVHIWMTYMVAIVGRLYQDRAPLREQPIPCPLVSAGRLPVALHSVLCPLPSCTAFPQCHHNKG